MKAISTVIASILMLMIVIALGGTTYLYISGTFTSKTATAFEIIDEVNGTVTIRNSGTETITSFSSVTLDGNPVSIAVVPNIDELVAYWSFNDGDGTVAIDSSDNGNDGTLVNSPAWTTGKYGNAVDFAPEVEDYVEVADATSLDFGNRPFTIEVVVYPQSFTKETVIFYKRTNNLGNAEQTGYMLFITTAGSVNMNVNQNPDVQSARTGSVIQPNTWYHIVGVVNGANSKVYVNGEDRTSANDIDGSLNTDTIVNGFVGYGNHINHESDAKIDELRIYNRALSENEIQQLYLGLVAPGQLAKVKPLTPLSKGTHALRLCTSSICNTAILTIV